MNVALEWTKGVDNLIVPICFNSVPFGFENSRSFSDFSILILCSKDNNKTRKFALVFNLNKRSNIFHAQRESVNVHDANNLFNSMDTVSLFFNIFVQKLILTKTKISFLDRHADSNVRYHQSTTENRDVSKFEGKVQWSEFKSYNCWTTSNPFDLLRYISSRKFQPLFYALNVSEEQKTKTILFSYLNIKRFLCDSFVGLYINFYKRFCAVYCHVLLSNFVQFLWMSCLRHPLPNWYKC